ncbi:MAG: polysaccharide biosynthesis C-terminal domain-containing protein, partial [Candidatus Eremiobacteraeota bacterium]|nr:polysaccharide biosynthesis C-terminal domain-containing protein [Candidatus Eremiobacteraeota bacterium]
SALIIKPVIVFLYGEAFAGSAPPILWLLPGAFCLGLEILIIRYFFSDKLPIFVPITLGIAMLINVGLNFLLIPWLGIIGAAITSTIAYSLIYIVLLIQFIKKTKTPVSKLFILQPGEFKEIIDNIKGFLPGQKNKKPAPPQNNV